MQTAHEMRTRIIDKAVNDSDYRAKLLHDPSTAVGEELRVPIPGSLSIHVHEEGPQTAHLVLPPASNLTEGDLQVAAGAGVMGDIGAIWRTGLVVPPPTPFHSRRLTMQTAH